MYTSPDMQVKIIIERIDTAGQVFWRRNDTTAKTDVIRQYLVFIFEGVCTKQRSDKHTL